MQRGGGRIRQVIALVRGPLLAGIAIGLVVGLATGAARPGLSQPSALAADAERRQPTVTGVDRDDDHVLGVPARPPAPRTPVRIAFGGDVHAEGPIRAALLAGDTPLDDVAPVFGSADLAVVNLETAVGVLGAPADKQFTFQAPAELVRALVAAGIDVVNLANNHALDYGVEALFETIAEAEAAGLRVVGAGRDADDAYAPVVIDVAGQRVAVVGLSRVLPVIAWAATSSRPGLASAYDEAAAVAAVRAAEQLADWVVVTIHWGTELADCPVKHQLRLAERLTAAGADVVVGHHPHVLQPIDTVNGAPVAYSLGNLVFRAFREQTRATAVLVAELSDDRVDLRVRPARIDDAGRPRLVTALAAAAVRDRLAAACGAPE
jgi:hypothetical protein